MDVDALGVVVVDSLAPPASSSQDITFARIAAAARRFAEPATAVLGGTNYDKRSGPYCSRKSISLTLEVIYGLIDRQNEQLIR